MAAKIQTYVVFYHVGVPFHTTTLEKVKERPSIDKVKMPSPDVFAFSFFDLEKGKRVNESPLYYYGGVVMTRAELKASGLDKVTKDKLLGIMREDKLKRIIRCRTGNFQPLYDNDVLVEEK
jgi:hypothetical protein